MLGEDQQRGGELVRKVEKGRHLRTLTVTSEMGGK